MQMVGNKCISDEVVLLGFDGCSMYFESNINIQEEQYVQEAPPVNTPAEFTNGNYW